MSNKKVKTTPQARVDQYLIDLTLKNGSLWCPWCSCYVDAERKSTIDYHVNSALHKKHKTGGANQSISNFIAVKQDPLTP